MLKTVGVAGAIGLAGCSGNGGDGGDGMDDGDGGDGGDGMDDGDGGDGGDGMDGGDGGDGGGGPDLLTVIGYPESGIQLFRDYYAASDGAEDILIPDGLQDPSLPGQVGNDMNNVTGTAPAAGGPNQEAFSSLYQDTYDETPGVFTSQSYDSAAALILANVAAGENDGTAIRDQLRRIANPDGTSYGPGEFVDAVEAVANGENINYQGASSAVNFDQNGDPASAAYQIWEFAGQSADSVNVQETQNFEGENPDGAGPSADSSPGGLGREVSVGILLPETGDLASTGQPMIRAAELPAQQVNESDLDLTVNAQFEDTNTSPDQGVTGAESLVNAGVPAVCGTASSGVNVPVCQETLIPNEVVGCSPSSTALSVTNLEDDDYIFRTAPSDQLQGRVMAQVASERLGASTAATLYVNNDYGQQLSNRFSSVFEDTFDGEVYDQISFNIGESSYSNVIEQALTSGN
ncbi:branched-chain/neutral amino acids amide ABC transporter periplasmic substrate-binding protein 1 [Halorubrum saccharovorum DSM 1137]|uniref:Branched-chain/neutral amino acids amide ABC transporter periplasmic substrate-binding protein 1 n=2 Tax=Halorubrum saccharovorum TaxID=2248 RepID=M0E899_9EURY|nr:branched-chain/neutral amino acids amide ABC transporter periplasmic substrate-binding protein 1 [Halorubrum saccharovorum DSM 1137]